MPDTISPEHLFSVIDARDAGQFAALLHEDAIFHFGNAPAVHGRDAIHDVVSGFFSSIAAVRHAVAEAWEPPGRLLCHGTVTYTRHDGSALAVPFANVLKTESGKARDYRIFVDISALYPTD